MKIDRTQCSKCKWRAWHRNTGGWSCGWSDHHRGQTCVYMQGGEKKDRRGTDPDDCLLFISGPRMRKRVAKKGEIPEFVEAPDPVEAIKRQLEKDKEKESEK